MNFEIKHGLIWISVELSYGGRCYIIDNCILDTGSATTAIDIECISFNYRNPSTIKRLFGIGGGVQEVITQNIEKINLGNIEVTNIEIEFGDLKEELGINGFIGNNILKSYRVVIDYPKKQLEIV